ncbi:MAG: transglycosylase SLT domain-containing protein [Bacteroidaceae bacterium]|nr:transglycosylase SLT domain-containing protein [Bacteroidaceae bacterium]
MKKTHAIIVTILVSAASLAACFMWDKHEITVETIPPRFDTIITQRPYPRYSISAYDELFREYGDTIGWDWKWLAAIAFVESHFNPDAVNESGASGLMQLMPKTAVAMGIDSLHRTDPRASVKGASLLFKRLSTRFQSIPMPDRVCFVLASYNAGHGHILDAMRLAEKYGSDSHLWYGSVDKYLRLKNEPHYYNDTICHNGKFSGIETTLFVEKVQKKYDEYSHLEDIDKRIHHPDTTLVPLNESARHQLHLKAKETILRQQLLQEEEEKKKNQSSNNQ